MYLTLAFTVCFSLFSSWAFAGQLSADYQIRLQGELKDFENIRSDGKVDFGVMIPALKRHQLLHFDISQMVSPESDTLTVLGREVNIPSNITLPPQRESYIFPITLNKPTYRMFAKDFGQQRFVAVHGQFPLKRVVDDLRAEKSIFDVINHFSLIGTGIADLELKDRVTTRDVSVNQIPFSQRIRVQAPSLSREQLMMTVALSELDGYLIPSDIKRLTSGQALDLSVPERGSKLAVSVLLRLKSPPRPPTLNPLMPLDPSRLFALPENLVYDVFKPLAQGDQVDLHQFSLAIHPRPDMAPRFLDWINPPQLVNEKELRFSPPRTQDNIVPYATYIQYTRIETTGSGQLARESRLVLWEQAQASWIESMTLPDLPKEPAQPNLSYRWELMFLGVEGLDVEATSVPIESVTHVTRNALRL